MAWNGLDATQKQAQSTPRLALCCVHKPVLLPPERQEPFGSLDN